MTDKQFVNGLNVKTIKTQYGDILNCSINTENIFNNPVNNEKYINFQLKKGKTGNWYS